MSTRINTVSASVQRNRKAAARAESQLAAAGSELAHTNPMRGVSFDTSGPFSALRMAAASCFFGEPQYYEATPALPQAIQNEELPSAGHLDALLGTGMPTVWRGLSTAARMEQAIDAALAVDVEKTLMVAAALRTEDHMRTTPQVIMVRAAYHPNASGTGLVKRYASAILKRADEPVVQLAYARSAFAGKPIPNALRKAWAEFLSEQSEYALAKYRRGTRDVKLVDVVNLARPKATDALGKLVRGELSLDGATWESVVSAGGSTKEAWTKARTLLVEPARHMALLRNLVNLEKHGLLDAPTRAALVAGAQTGKQLPFRYFTAHSRLKTENASPWALEAVEQCLAVSLGNLPRFYGRVMSLCDNSGSARGATTSELGTVRVNEIANLTGTLTGMAADEGYVGVFGDRLDVRPVLKTHSVFEQLAQYNACADSIGTGTENGIWLFFRKALAEKEHWDHVFVYSDMQAGHGKLFGTQPAEYANHSWPGNARYIDVASLIRRYHQEVNPDCRFYLVQVAGYQDTLAPDFYPNVTVLGGWGPGLLKFAHAMGEAKAAPAPRGQR